MDFELRLGIELNPRVEGAFGGIVHLLDGLIHIQHDVFSLPNKKEKFY